MSSGSMRAKVRLLSEENKRAPLSFQKILDLLDDESHYILVVIFLIPFLQPLSIPGLSTPIGGLILILIIYGHFQWKPKIPKRWAEKTFSVETMEGILKYADKIFIFLEKYIHPRLGFLQGGAFRYFNSILMLVSTLLLMLPLPIPFSNAIPAWGILLLALGHLEDDGVLILIAYAHSVVCSLFFYGLLVALIQPGIEKAMQWFSSI